LVSPLERFRSAERASYAAPSAASQRRAADAIFRDIGSAVRDTNRQRNDVLSGLTGGSDDTPAPDPGPQGSTAGVSQLTFQYPSVLPPLSAEAQRAFAERRRAATRALEESRAQVDRQRQQAEAAAVQGRRDIGRQQAEQSRQGMAELAGRGVARSPMFVNPFQRGVARAAQQRVGELEMGLSQTLENLSTALRQAEQSRARELSDIEADIMAARSNVPMLLGIA